MRGVEAILEQNIHFNATWNTFCSFLKPSERARLLKFKKPENYCYRKNQCISRVVPKYIAKIKQ